MPRFRLAPRRLPLRTVPSLRCIFLVMTCGIRLTHLHRVHMVMTRKAAVYALAEAVRYADRLAEMRSGAELEAKLSR